MMWPFFFIVMIYCYRQSSCFSRGTSSYRGVTRCYSCFAQWTDNHLVSFERSNFLFCLTREVLVVCCKFATFSNQCFTNRRKDGKWQARIGRIGESRDTKDIYLGTFGEWSFVIYYLYLVELPKVFYQLESYCRNYPYLKLTMVCRNWRRGGRSLWPSSNRASWCSCCYQFWH